MNEERLRILNEIMSVIKSKKLDVIFDVTDYSSYMLLNIKFIDVKAQE